VSRLALTDLIRPGSLAEAGEKYNHAHGYRVDILDPINRKLQDRRRSREQNKATRDALRAQLNDLDVAIYDDTKAIDKAEEELEAAINAYAMPG